MEQQQWVVKSLAVWGMVVAVVVAVIPGINAVWPEFNITPEWVSTLDAAAKPVLVTIGVLVGIIMVAVDRFTGESKKTLVLRNPNK